MPGSGSGHASARTRVSRNGVGAALLRALRPARRGFRIVERPCRRPPISGAQAKSRQRCRTGPKLQDVPLCRSEIIAASCSRAIQLADSGEKSAGGVESPYRMALQRLRRDLGGCPALRMARQALEAPRAVEESGGIGKLDGEEHRRKKVVKIFSACGLARRESHGRCSAGHLCPAVAPRPPHSCDRRLVQCALPPGAGCIAEIAA